MPVATKKRGRRKVNKSEKIREYRAANPEAKTSEIVEGLKAANVIVTPQLVSNTVSRLGGKKKRLGRPRSGQLTVGHLEEAHVFSKKVGSLQLAKEAILGLERIRAL